LDEAKLTRNASPPLELLHVSIQFLVDRIALEQIKRVYIGRVLGLADVVCVSFSSCYCFYISFLLFIASSLLAFYFFVISFDVGF
jgi:hypothetical protein